MRLFIKRSGGKYGSRSQSILCGSKRCCRNDLLTIFGDRASGESARIALTCCCIGSADRPVTQLDCYRKGNGRIRPTRHKLLGRLPTGRPSTAVVRQISWANIDAPRNYSAMVRCVAAQEWQSAASHRSCSRLRPVKGMAATAHMPREGRVTAGFRAIAADRHYAFRSGCNAKRLAGSANDT